MFKYSKWLSVSIRPIERTLKVDLRVKTKILDRSFAIRCSLVSNPRHEFDLIHTWNPNSFCHLRSVDLRAMVLREHFTFLKVLWLEPHHQMVYCPIQDTHWSWFTILLIFVGFYDTSNIRGYSMPNAFLCIYTFLLQTIQFSISTEFKCQNSFISNNPV